MNHSPTAAVLPAHRLVSPWSLAGLGILLVGVLLLNGCAGDGNAGADRSTMDSGRQQVNLRAGVPSAAREVAQGKGSLDYTAQGDGQVYVYDVSDNKIVGNYNIAEGQELIVAPRAGRATLASNELVIDELHGTRTYVLYFLPFEGQTYQLTPTNRNRD